MACKACGCESETVNTFMGPHCKACIALSVCDVDSVEIERPNPSWGPEDSSRWEAKQEAKMDRLAYSKEVDSRLDGIIERRA